MKVENYGKANLKAAYKLTPAHIDPKGYQKMNVGLAFQAFSRQVWAAMELYREMDVDLNNCTPTIAFIKKFEVLIQAMTSRTNKDALRPENKYHKVSNKGYL